jgi:hypothetical protein
MNNAHYKTMEGFKKESHISILSLPVTAGIYDLEKSAIAETIEEPESAAMTFAKAIKADLESIEITGLQR